jgi:hypothetical protein
VVGLGGYRSLVEEAFMPWIPSVRALLAERLIFNFRLPPKALAELLPAKWLAPQIVNGFGIASFCMLDLRKITIAPPNRPPLFEHSQIQMCHEASTPYPRHSISAKPE